VLCVPSGEVSVSWCVCQWRSCKFPSTQDAPSQHTTDASKSSPGSPCQSRQSQTGRTSSAASAHPRTCLPPSLLNSGPLSKHIQPVSQSVTFILHNSKVRHEQILSRSRGNKQYINSQRLMINRLAKSASSHEFLCYQTDSPSWACRRSSLGGSQCTRVQRLSH
jgi:hypothetical protein